MLYRLAIDYANDVLDGKEITNKYVKKQCQLFLDDLERQHDGTFPYYLDTEELEKVEGILSLVNFATGLNVVGRSILEGLEGFQAFFLCNIFGWRFRANSEKHRFRDVTLFVPRKNGKTWLVGLILIILMLTEDDFSEFYSICKDRELAGEVKKAIAQILNASPHIGKYFTVPKTLSGKVVCKLTKSYFQPRTADASANNAIRPSAKTLAHLLVIA